MSQGLHIVHLAKYLPASAGDREAATGELARAGLAAGARVTVLGTDLGQQAQTAEDIHGIEQVALPSAGTFGPVLWLPAYFKLKPHLALADIIHLHLPNPLGELALLHYLLTTPRAQWPKIVPVMHIDSPRWPQLAAWWENLVIAPLLQRSDRVIVAAAELAQHIPALQAIRDKIDILPFPTAPALVQTLRTTRPEVEILVVGRLVHYKGYDLLLEALAGLTQRWHLTIVGDGPELETLMQQAAALEISSRVDFVGQVAEAKKQRLLSTCDLFVAPSRRPAESYGLVIAEAFSYGKAVITSALPTGAAYLARGGRCGALVPAGSAAALRDALDALLVNPIERRQCGQDNLRFWQAELTREHFAERYQATVAALTGAPLRLGLARAG